jgi:beta-lactam-binding protein with PASTA domain
MSLVSARSLLEAIGFDVAEQLSDDARAPEGTVVSAQPEAGTRRPLPAVVTLLVSRGAPRDSAGQPLDTAGVPMPPRADAERRDGADR